MRRLRVDWSDDSSGDDTKPIKIWRTILLVSSLILIAIAIVINAVAGIIDSLARV